MPEDERQLLLKSISKRIDSLVDHLTSLQTELQKDIGELQDELKIFQRQLNALDKKTVKYDMSTSVTFGLVGIILTAFIGGVLVLVFK